MKKIKPRIFNCRRLYMGIPDKVQHAYVKFGYSKSASNTNYFVDM